jgi:hypothetical protein
MSRGIDYGGGVTNIDPETGIRYGVIPMNELHEFAHESFEDDYGDPTCPKCGGAPTANDPNADDPVDPDEADYCVNCHHHHGGPPESEGVAARPSNCRAEGCDCDEFEHAEPEHGRGCDDYYCQGCNYFFDSSEAFGDEPVSSDLNDDGYAARLDGDGDVFVFKAPYKTRAQFCSPCAPGACHLSNPTDDGDWAYCFGHDWFEGDVAPYPVYSVETGELVPPPVKATHDLGGEGGGA